MTIMDLCFILLYVIFFVLFLGSVCLFVVVFFSKIYHFSHSNVCLKPKAVITHKKDVLKVEKGKRGYEEKAWLMFCGYTRIHLGEDGEEEKKEKKEEEGRRRKHQKCCLNASAVL